MLFEPLNLRSENSKFRIPLQCIWLKLNGSWPLAKRRQMLRSTLREHLNAGYIFDCCYTLWAWYVIASVGITISFQTAFLIDNFGDIMMTTENCCTTFMGILNFIRLLHIRLQQHRFRQIIEYFVADIWIPDGTNESIDKFCHKRMSTFRIMTALLACLILMYCVLPLIELFFLDGLQAEIKPFPYKMIFPFNPYTSWYRYFFVYMFTSYAGICVVTTLFAEDSILGFFITYTCGQFLLLHKCIDELVVSATRNFNTDEALQREYVRRQKAIVRQHNKLIAFANYLEEFFNPMLLVNIMISSVLICMVGFQLATGNNMFIGDYVKFIVYISSSISQLYILCGNGDTLIQHSLLTAKHLYNCNWEGGANTVLMRRRSKSLKYPPANKEFRTNLRFMILCSQRPVKITAFKFSTLSLQSFTAILSTSMSYFTLLRSVFDNQK